eukprot:CAMPEP_0114481318 /NCGR_PEP_ID=MMETSP0104-20121206/17622_1 /TAXON_ID=37642 ORGANISM="Paraphysomonas imperforata, Strain PA2" /NCGR_SAMPLE_ID=MMETSP0104 /ASSEMBLY_ACC=CAM_ASM_000202 /LENGTH=877 /DNA_ID=CAMNT_0001656903 /DNA_START=74 /DNA_END=2708 /DNA_ORIENTATION=+
MTITDAEHKKAVSVVLGKLRKHDLPGLLAAQRNGTLDEYVRPHLDDYLAKTQSKTQPNKQVAAQSSPVKKTVRIQEDVKPNASEMKDPIFICSRFLSQTILSLNVYWIPSSSISEQSGAEKRRTLAMREYVKAATAIQHFMRRRWNYRAVRALRIKNAERARLKQQMIVDDLKIQLIESAGQWKSEKVAIIAEFKAEFEELSAALQAVERELETSNAKVESLTEELKLTKEDFQELDAEFAEYRDSNPDSNAKVESLTEELKLTKEDFQELDAEFAEYRDSNPDKEYAEALEIDVNTVRDDLRQARERADLLEKDYSKFGDVKILADTLQDQVAEYKKKEEEHAQQLVKPQEEFDALSHKYDQAITALDKAKFEAEYAKADVEQLMAMADQMKSDLEESRTEAAIAKDDAENMRSKADRANMEVLEARAELEECQNQVVQLVKKCRAYESDVEETAKQVEKVENCITELDKAVTERDEAIKVLQFQNNELVDILKTRDNTLIESATVFEDREKALEDGVDNIVQELMKVKEEKDELQRDFDEVARQEAYLSKTLNEVKQKHFEEEVGKLKSDMEKSLLSDRYSAVQNKLQIAEEESKKARLEASELAAKLVTAKEQLSAAEYQQDLNEIKNVVKHLEGSLKAAVEENAALRSGGTAGNDKEAEKCRELSDWLTEHTRLGPSKSVKYATVFVKDGKYSVKRLKKAVKNDGNYLRSVGVHQDAAAIIEALNLNAGSGRDSMSSSHVSTPLSTFAPRQRQSRTPNGRVSMSPGVFGKSRTDQTPDKSVQQSAKMSSQSSITRPPPSDEGQNAASTAAVEKLAQLERQAAETARIADEASKESDRVTELYGRRSSVGGSRRSSMDSVHSGQSKIGKSTYRQ